MYILGENKIKIWWDLFTATYQGKVAFNLNPELGVGGGGVQHTLNCGQIFYQHTHTPSLYTIVGSAGDFFCNLPCTWT